MRRWPQYAGASLQASRSRTSRYRSNERNARRERRIFRLSRLVPVEGSVEYPHRIPRFKPELQRESRVMIKDWINPFISFRARILIFVTIIVLTTIAAIYFISRHLEQRIAGLVAEHIKEISVSVDLAQSSF